MNSVKTLIPLGKVSSREVEAFVRNKYPRRKNWIPPSPSTVEREEFWVKEINRGRYSRRCPHTLWSYEPHVTCCAVVTEPADLGFYWRNSLVFLQPPRGYRWDADDNGVRLVSLTNLQKDYHPNSDDLRWYSKRKMLALINERYRVRVKARRAARADRIAVRNAEKEGARICLRDSLKAGNCEAGSRAFAARHKLDATKHYRPTDLLKIANGETYRVRLAVAVGLRRHRKEMQQGFALLEDHR